MMDIIKKVLNIVSKILILALVALIVVIVLAINPFYVPVIFRNNYPAWFDAHPLLRDIIDKIYWSHLDK